MSKTLWDYIDDAPPGPRPVPRSGTVLRVYLDGAVTEYSSALILSPTECARHALECDRQERDAGRGPVTVAILDANTLAVLETCTPQDFAQRLRLG